MQENCQIILLSTFIIPSFHHLKSSIHHLARSASGSIHHLAAAAAPFSRQYRSHLVRITDICVPSFSSFCSLVSRSSAIFLVVASGWHPDIPPLIVLCPRVLISLRSNDFFRERVLPSSFVHCAGCYPAFLSYVHSPALNAGFHFVHCAGCYPAY